MKGLRWVAVLAALLLVAPVGSLSAQSSISFHIGGGALIPTGDLADEDHQTGWMAFAGIGRGLGTSGKLGIGLTGFYGSSEIKNTTDVSTTIIGGAVGLEYMLMTSGTVRPYIAGMAGFLSRDTEGAEEEESKFMFGGGAGLSFGRVFIDGRIAIADGTDFFVIGLGLVFGGGM